jgi:hypothetical protein
VAASHTTDGIKVILPNPVMIKACKEASQTTEGRFRKVRSSQNSYGRKSNPESRYRINVPCAVKSVALIEKDSKRVPDTNGRGYAEFTYDRAFAAFKPVGR